MISLTHPRHKEVFQGRLFEEKGELVFEEESSWLRVQVEKPSHLSGRALETWTGKALYEGLRASTRLQRRRHLERLGRPWRRRKCRSRQVTCKSKAKVLRAR